MTCDELYLLSLWPATSLCRILHLNPRFLSSIASYDVASYRMSVRPAVVNQATSARVPAPPRPPPDLRTNQRYFHITSKACFLGHFFYALIAAATARFYHLGRQEAAQNQICVFVCASLRVSAQKHSTA